MNTKQFTEEKCLVEITTNHIEDGARRTCNAGERHRDRVPEYLDAGTEIVITSLCPDVHAKLHVNGSSVEPNTPTKLQPGSQGAWGSLPYRVSHIAHTSPQSTSLATRATLYTSCCATLSATRERAALRTGWWGKLVFRLKRRKLEKVTWENLVINPPCPFDQGRPPVRPPPRRRQHSEHSAWARARAQPQPPPPPPRRLPRARRRWRPRTLRPSALP